MFIKNWKTEILTIPNLLSLLRLVLVPVCLQLYLRADTHAQFLAAGLVLGLSCLTDALDGLIARKFHMISTLGKILDPLADKFTQFALMVAVSLRNPVLVPVLILFAVKEVIQTGFGIFSLRQGRILPGALMEGKICTTVLFFSLIILILFPTIPKGLVRTISIIDGIFLCLSLVSYCSAYFGVHPKTQELKRE